MNIFKRFSTFLVGLLVGLFAGFIVFFIFLNNVKFSFLNTDEFVFTESDTIVDKRQPVAPKSEATMTQQVMPTLIIRDTISITSNNPIQIERDRLIIVKPVVPSYIGDAEKRKNDSLLISIGGIPTSYTPRVINVEYWESAINFKGYSWVDNDLKLYGIFPDEDIKFLSTENSMYLEIPYKKVSYELVQTPRLSKFKKTKPLN